MKDLKTKPNEMCTTHITLQRFCVEIEKCNFLTFYKCHQDKNVQHIKTKHENRNKTISKKKPKILILHGRRFLVRIVIAF